MNSEGPAGTASGPGCLREEGGLGLQSPWEVQEPSLPGVGVPFSRRGDSRTGKNRNGQETFPPKARNCFPG